MATNEQNKANPSIDTAEFLGGKDVAATFAAHPDSSLLELLKRREDVAKIDVFSGETGVNAFETSGIIEKIQRALSEEKRPFEILTDSLKDDGVVLVLTLNSDSIDVDSIANDLAHNGAGWIFHFDDLTWSELHTPASAGADR